MCFDLQIGSRIKKKHLVLLVLSRPSMTSSKGSLFNYLLHCEGCFQSTYPPPLKRCATNTNKPNVQSDLKPIVAL